LVSTPPRTDGIAVDQYGFITEIDGLSTCCDVFYNDEQRNLDGEIIAGNHRRFHEVSYGLGMREFNCNHNSFAILSEFGGVIDRLGIGLYIGYSFMRNMRVFANHVWFATADGLLIDTCVPEGKEVSYIGTDILRLRKNEWKPSGDGKNPIALYGLQNYFRTQSNSPCTAKTIGETDMTPDSHIGKIFAELAAQK